MAPGMHMLLRAHRDEIIAEWETLASAETCAAKLAGTALRDNVPQLLDQLAAWMERGDGPAAAARLCSGACLYALQRLDHSYRLYQLFHEYALLRAAILRGLLRAEALEQAEAGAGATERHVELARLQAGLDFAISRALERFIAQRERRLSARQGLQRRGGRRVQPSPEAARRAARARRAQRDLHAKEERLRAHIDNSPLAVIEFDPQFRVTRWSKEAERVFGWTADETIGRRLAESHWIHEEDLESVRRESRRLLSGAGTRTLSVHRNYRKDGSIVHCEWYSSALHDAQGRLISILSQVLDVTDRRRVEQELRESEERFRTLADSIAQLAWMADEEGSRFWFNKRWFDFTGTTLEEVRGWGWRKLHHPDHVGRVVEKLTRCFRTGEPWEDTCPLRGRDGAFRWFLSRAVPIRDESGRVVRWFGTATDVTEQREAQEALRAADQRKTEFLAVLSHELRNCLAPIKNGLRLLERTPPGSPQSHRAGEIVRRQMDHVTRLVEDLLDVSRIATGKLRLERTRFDAREVVRRLCEDVRATFEERGIALRLAVASEPLWVDADQTRLTQIAGNLLGNALKFTSSPGTVDVTIGALGDTIELRVRDTGAGIDPHFLGNLFEPFAQAERTRGISRGGMGIGLPLVKNLVTMLGGAVRAMSEGKGKGTEFVVSLPLAAAPPVHVPKPPLAAIPSLAILVVEDNRDGAETLDQLLRLEGHRTRLAFDGGSAMVAFREFAPDVLISDIALPDVGGYDLIRAIRRAETGHRVFAVALTGYADADDVEQARRAGFDAHLAKPAPLERLDELLAEAAARRAEGKAPPQSPPRDVGPAESGAVRRDDAEAVRRSPEARPPFGAEDGHGPGLGR